MATFDSAGAGFARGFARGRTIRQNQQALEAQQRRAETEAEIRRQAAMRETFTRARNQSLDVFNRAVELAGKAAQNGAPPDSQVIQQLKVMAVASLGSFARTAQELRARAVAAGAAPEQIQQLPDGLAFVQNNLPLFDAAVEVGNLSREGKSSTFFADVEGVGNARVTAIQQPDQTFKFSIDGQEVPASAIAPPVQRTQEVRDIVIPGLTDSQTGQVLDELRAQGAAVNSFTEMANSVLTKIGDDARKVGTLGDFVRGLASFASQAGAVAKMAGLDAPFEGSLDDFNFGSLADASQQVKTTLLNLVYLDLASKGQTGRSVSDRDLQIFMDANGFSTGDPSQVASAMQATVENNQLTFRNNVLVRGGGAVGVRDILPDGLSEFQSEDNTADILMRAEEALNAGDLDKAEQLLEQIDSGNP